MIAVLIGGAGADKNSKFMLTLILLLFLMLCISTLIKKRQIIKNGKFQNSKTDSIRTALICRFVQLLGEFEIHEVFSNGDIRGNFELPLLFQEQIIL